jgi:lipoprotein-anchoring transpeptidase ErfK/SrfK
LRQRSFLVVVGLVAIVLGTLAGVVYAYDSGRKEQIAQGVTIGGIPVGGLTRQVAESRVRATLLDPLRQPIIVAREDKAWRLGPREAQITADIPAMVDEALAISRRGWLLGRVVRELTGGRVWRDVPAPVTYSESAVVRLLDRVRTVIDRPAVDAGLQYSAAGIERVPSKDGVRVAADALHRAIRSAIITPGSVRTFIAPVERVRPKVSTAGLAAANPVVLIVDRVGFRLRLYKRLRLARTYRIAVGQAGLETPSGLYNIQWKEKNPTWHVPKRPWAKELAGKDIPPGDPRNPIKARWLAVFDGAGIHGTSDDGSIGSAASHGCIRMHIPDVIELYDEVPVGAPVYIA